MPLAHEFQRGGYEVEGRSTYFEPGTADKLLQCVLGWLSEREQTVVAACQQLSASMVNVTAATAATADAARL